ncbi:sensor histidine kinase [Bacillus sp. es.034]|uniref:sensor histidine kinase n=1 Tax=Bacillus sp. es.034 TaxID=1761763 RepID=UPI000BF77407|nr:sensor histidine kinase [Bacillus sp. es.034]PFG03692.1 two-component system, NarL family, sensor histidine kinase LiaS [Bacillus sp. es.034]
MSTVSKQVVAGILFSLVMVLFLSFSFFYLYPLQDWSLLWEVEIMDIPGAGFILVFSIVIGIGFGIRSGLKDKRQLREMEDALHHVEQGRTIIIPETATSEVQQVWKKVDALGKHLTDQARYSQKLANEKAEEQEKRIQEIVSQERNRFARELHDSVSQQLFAASMLMSAITETPSPHRTSHEEKQLGMVEQMIHQSQLEMRALLLHLRPVALKGKNLQEGMKELLVELAQKVPLDIEWKIEDMSLDKGIEDHLFRILQESVSNTLRHAKATSLDIRLIKRESIIILRVVDDGLGFDVNESKVTSSYGLQNMRERAIEIGGTFKVVSVPNKGTRLEVKVPVVENEGDKND